MSVIDYAATGNTSVSGISIATGMAPSSVDNAMRKIIDDIGEGLANGYFATALPATKSAGYTVLTTDRGKLFNCTSALTLALPASATAAAGFMFWVKANGAAVILDPNAAELIDGAATVTIASGSSAFVVCTGTAWVTAFVATSYDWAAAVVAAAGKTTPIDADSIGIVDSAAANVLKETTIGELKAAIFANTALTGAPTAPTPTAGDDDTSIATTEFVNDAIAARSCSKKIFTSDGTWTKPSGLVKVVVTVIGGGGGGGGTSTANTGIHHVGGSGGGGGVAVSQVLAASLGTTETVTVGTAGTAGNTSGSSGGNGGTTSFGVHAVAGGGALGGGANAASGSNDTGSSGLGGAGSTGNIFIGDGQNAVGAGGASPSLYSGATTQSFGKIALSLGASATGTAGPSNTGVGGLGGYATNGAGRAGGAGGSGIVIVEEYFA